MPLALPHPRRPGRPGGHASPERRDRRIKVSAITRVETADGERAVRVVGLSARSVLLYAPDAVGEVGQCVELYLPILGGRELRVMAGIVSGERVKEGYVVTAELMVADVESRRQLAELLALLLPGAEEDDGGPVAVVYDVAVPYGPTGQTRGRLQELSVAGLSMRVEERIAFETVLPVTIPPWSEGAALELRARVVGQQLSPEGGYSTKLVFEGLDGDQRRALGALIAELMCR